MQDKKLNINELLESITTGNIEFDLPSLFEEKLNECNLSKTKVAYLLDMDLKTLESVIYRKGNPTITNVIKVAQFIEIDNLHYLIPSVISSDYEIISDLENARNASFIAKNFDIKRLINTGFLSEGQDTKEIVKRLLGYFGFTSLSEYSKNITDPLFSRTKNKFTDKMKKFWVQSAFKCFVDISNPNEYDREALKEIIIKIRPYTQDVENGLYLVCKALYNVGVTVIVQSHLTTTQVRGGTFIVNEKPCIVLTDLNKRYTTIWETLIHELHHVLHDIDTIKYTGFHLSGESDIFLIEENAIFFSREFFCGYEDYLQIKPHINNPFLVERFAKRLEIDKSFVYSSFRQFQKIHHNKNYYSAFNEFFPKYQDAIKRLKPITWKETSLTEIAKEIKTIFELENTYINEQ